MNDDRKVSILVTGMSIMVIMVIGMWGVMLYGEAARDSMSVNIGKGLKAMVKGSIYENGEYMSVFGTCTNEYDMPLNASGYFKAWYPNGTQFIFNDTAASIATGYFIWNGNMQMVAGTYLTEFECFYENQTAKAWGEWQNPVWVNRMATILTLTNNSWALLMDINGTVVGINQTLDGMNVTLTNVEELIKALTVTGLRRYYFYNESSLYNSSYTVMNLSVPAFNSSGVTGYGPLATGTYELARRIYADEPNLTIVLAGIYKQHTTINKTAGTKNLRIFSNIYIRHADGSLSLVGDSVGSDVITVGYQDVDWVGTIPNDHILLPGDHVVMILNATVSGVGSNPEFSLHVEGATGAALELGAEGDFATNENIYNITVIASIDIANLTLLLSNLTNITIGGFGNLTEAMAANFTYTNSLISEVNTSIYYLSQNISSSFNQTNTLILATNQSWDSNSTLIAQLLYILLNYSTSPPTPTANLTFIPYQVDDVTYWKYWTIKGRVYSLTGKKYVDPTVYCLINTTLTGQQYMEPEGDHFTSTIFISSESDFQYAVGCYFS